MPSIVLVIVGRAFTVKIAAFDDAVGAQALETKHRYRYPLMPWVIFDMDNTDVVSFA